MDYSSDFNNSSDYITTTDTSINESETDASINVSDSESLESFEMDQHVELSIDEPEYDESSDDVVMSQTSDLDDFDEDNNDSNVYDSDSELLSTENDSDFDFVYHEDVISFEVSNVFDNQVPQSRNVLHDLSVNMHNLGPFRQRSNTLEQCSICFEVILRDEETMSLACTHMFHTKCVLPWLQRNQTCPNCRKRI